MPISGHSVSLTHNIWSVKGATRPFRKKSSFHRLSHTKPPLFHTLPAIRPLYLYGAITSPVDLLAVTQQEAFREFAAVVLLSAGVGALAIWLRQPLIVAFIAVGIVAGPSAASIVTQHQQLSLLSAMGISILLFVVGLKLDVHLIRTIGSVALATGLGQVVFTSAIGYLIVRAFGIETLPAIYISVALTFSSTIIIVKLLSDKRELDSLHGRIAVGFLIVQDIVVVIAMIFLAALRTGAMEDATTEFGLVILKGFGFIGLIVLLMRVGLPNLMNAIAKSPELLVLFSIAWAFALAAAGDMLGFSKEVGAFLAGVSIASTPYREAVASRLVSVRDFLLLFFFIDLGSRLELDLLGAQVPSAIVLSLFVLIGNPIIVMAIMGAMGYRRRTGFLAGLTVAQISEFSLIMMSLGFTIGHVTRDHVGLVTLVGLITIGLSTYMIIYSHYLYDRLSPFLKIFERPTAHSEQLQDIGVDCKPDVIVFGVGRFGTTVMRELHKRGYQVLGIDFDPVAIRNCAKNGLPVQYGDATDAEFAATLPLSTARWIVTTIPDRDIGASLIHAVRSAGYKRNIAVTAHSEADKEWLIQRGADFVFMPFVDAGVEAVERLADSLERR